MMSAGPHACIAGRSARARALARLLDHSVASGGVWVARRIDIHRHWMKVHPRMTIDDPTLLKVTTAFLEYERALMTNGIPAMDLLFHDASTTNRYGVGEVLYRIAEIREFRKGRGGSPQRKPAKIAITVHGDRFATADAELFRANSRRRGPQTQSWVKFPDGWKVDSAHVSMEESIY